MITNDEFIQLVKDSPYTIKEIAEMIETPYATVKNWTRGKDSTSYRVMPKHALIAVMLSIKEIERIVE